MLLTRLELRNFLAYRTPDPINLQGVGLACLSGPNGAGKSSLLDAVTWGLWGRARARSDDELIHTGQSDMAVVVEFEQHGKLYRVVRKRAKKGGELYLYTFDANGLPIPIHSGLREAQPEIIRLLHLDYDTFVNSAFLQQGKADVFTLKTPGERKKVLADILGLKRWEGFEEIVKEKLKKIDFDLNLTTSRIEELEAEELKEPALRQQLDEVTLQVAAAAEARAVAEDRYDTVKGAADRKKAAQNNLADVRQRIAGYQRNLAEVEAEIEAQRKRAETYHNVIAAAESIEQGYAELEHARLLDKDLHERMKRHTDAEKRFAKLQRQIDTERVKLEQDAAHLRANIGQAERLSAQVGPLTDDLLHIEQQITAFEARRDEREALQAELGKINGEASFLETSNRTLKTDMDTIQERLAMLKSAGDDAACPVCRQPLDQTHRFELESQFKAEGTERGNLFRANKLRIKEIESLLKGHEGAIRTIDVELRRLDVLKTQAGETREKLASAQDSAARAEQEAAALQAVESTLAQNDYAVEIRAQQDAVRAEIESLGYDEQSHDETRQALEQLSAYERHKRDLDLAVAALPGVELAVAAAHDRQGRWQEDLTRECAAEEQVLRNIAELTTLADEEKRRYTEVQRRRLDERKAADDKISVEQRLKAVTDARTRKQELVERRNQMSEERGVYDTLREAFGKNGVPAMIIEAAIPELEHESNVLLKRITDGKMNVRFDTQREKKSGGVAETLDILISDELGTRDYAMYSGGEGFRVNFAVRVALSQMLARRAGARLQTLFIDEGFGSQDSIGRERLLEAINAIRDQFDLILVVTHIDEMRDAFPVHIRVSKDENGASVEIVA